MEKIGQLEEEVAEKDEKVEAAMQELETQQSELAAKDHLIQNLHQDLHRVSLYPSHTHTPQSSTLTYISTFPTVLSPFRSKSSLSKTIHFFYLIVA